MTETCNTAVRSSGLVRFARVGWRPGVYVLRKARGWRLARYVNAGLPGKIAAWKKYAVQKWEPKSEYGPGGWRDCCITKDWLWALEVFKEKAPKQARNVAGERLAGRNLELKPRPYEY